MNDPLTPPAIDQAIRLALQHHQAGRMADAEAIYRQILAAKPDHADALHLLGVMSIQLGRNDDAIGLIGRAISVNPASPAFRCNLGIALGNAKRLDESIIAFRRAIEIKPDYADAYINLGNAFCEKGDFEQALVAAYRGVQLNPNVAEAHNNLAHVLREYGKLDEAIAACLEARRLKPELPGLHSNLGNCLFERGRLEEAIASHREALRLQPDFPQALSNLGNALREVGEIDEAVACYRRSVELSPNDPSFHSNLIFALLFDIRLSEADVFAEHLRWARKFADPVKSLIRPHANDRNPDRRLRIGYVSRDFRGHPVGRFLLPLLANHNHQQFEIFCYSSVLAPDNITARLRSYADHWVDIPALTDARAADRIRTDRIDILVDLTLHSASNRMPLFALKPAPVQATYLAYPGTSGIDAMDYRITDPYLDPPDSSQRYYSERSIRLPRTYWCYEPPAQSQVAPLPAESAGCVTFGCLNNFSKMNARVIETWREILAAVPNSQLLLHGAPGPHRDAVARQFSGRVMFVERVPIPDYLQQYHRIDIALDPFPYCGGTTSCDALWLGVPLITLRGQTALGRGGVSILSNLGLNDWIAEDVRQYISIATQKSSDLPGLAHLRATLRERMRNSPLMDGPQFARDIESAFRAMWRQYCERVSSSASGQCG